MVPSEIGDWRPDDALDAGMTSGVEERIEVLVEEGEYAMKSVAIMLGEGGVSIALSLVMTRGVAQTTGGSMVNAEVTVSVPAEPTFVTERRIPIEGLSG